MYCVCSFDLDPIQGQGHGAFELPTTSEAVHAGGDDRSPLAGLSGVPVALPLTFFQFLLHMYCHSWHKVPCMHILLCLPCLVSEWLMGSKTSN